MDIRQLEANLATKKAALKTLAEDTMRAAQEHVVTPATATTPAVTGRVMTAEETARLKAATDECREIQARIDGLSGDARMLAEIERLTAAAVQPTPAARPDDRQQPRPSIGSRLMHDPAMVAWLKAGQHHAQGQWTSPGVEAPYSDLRATLIDTSSGSGGPLLIPDYLPGVVQIPTRAPVVADLIAPGTTDSNQIIYMKELAYTNAAAGVLEGVAKPESAISFVQATDPVTKIATWIPVTTEALEDIPAMSSMIDARLRTFLSLAEDDQLLNGNGTLPNMRGIMNRLALAAAIARGADSSVDAVFKQISAIYTNALMQPDGWVMNPLNWLTIQLTKNAQGNYLGTGPWAAAQTPVLWGLPGAITPAMVANTALVGAFKTCAQFFRKGGVKVAMSNSHASFFIENKVAVLIEERGALAVYREAAFGKVTGLN
jgi:HK97 family phage major capsid protein